MLTLSTRRCPAPRLAYRLEEAGAAYEARRRTSRPPSRREARLPRDQSEGAGPALVTERGVLTETPAILAYVAQAWPAAGLAPLDDPFAFAQMQAFMSYLSSTVHVAHAHRGAATAGLTTRRRSKR